MKRTRIPALITLTMPLVFAMATEKLSAQPLKDLEGYVYRTVTVGRQRWMAENLKTEWDGHGRKLTGVTAYERDERHVPVYGRLYTREAAEAACPIGWRLPTQLDFESLFVNVAHLNNPAGGWSRSEAGLLLKASDSRAWRPSDALGLDSAGYEAMPAGVGFLGDESTDFTGLGEVAAFWSGTATQDLRSAWAVGTRYDSAAVQTGFYDSRHLLSVRYVQDLPMEQA